MSLLTTIKAIHVALRDTDFNSPKEMKRNITIALGFIENALESEKPEAIEYKEIFDDENPDYIKMSQEEI